VARHRPRREDAQDVVQLHAARAPGRLPIPGPEPPGQGAIHHLVRRPRGCPDRSQLAAQAQVRLARALLPGCRALHAHGNDSPRSHALGPREGGRPRIRRQADAGSLLGLAAQHHVRGLAGGDSNGAGRRGRLRAEDGRYGQGAAHLLRRGRRGGGRCARGVQLRGHLQAAGDLRVREQRLRHLNPVPQGVRNRVRRAARGGLRIPRSHAGRRRLTSSRAKPSPAREPVTARRSSSAWSTVWERTRPRTISGAIAPRRRSSAWRKTTASSDSRSDCSTRVS